jgi:hypothetical protein
MRISGTTRSCRLRHKVAVPHVISDQPPKMLLVQRDDMVEDLAAATSDPAFRDSILPGRQDARLPGLQARRFHERDDIAVKLRVAVEDDVSIRRSFGKRFAQLLHNPLGGRVSRWVEVQDLASPMFGREEAVKHGDQFAENTGLRSFPRRRGQASEALRGSWGLPSLGSLPPSVGSDRGSPRRSSACPWDDAAASASTTENPRAANRRRSLVSR